MHRTTDGIDFDPKSIRWVMEKQDVRELLAAIATCTEVVTDLETTALDEYAVLGGRTNGGYPARVVLQSLTLPQPDDDPDAWPTTWVVPLSHPDSPFLGVWQQIFAVICQTIRKHRKPIVNQNVKFDMRWVKKHAGVDLSRLVMWCTMTAAHMQDELRSNALGDQVPAIFGVPSWKSFDFKSPGEAERVPLFDLGLYGAKDTAWVWRWARWQRYVMNLFEGTAPRDAEEYENDRLGRLMHWVSMPTVRTLTQIEQRGMLLDEEWTRAELADYTAEAEQAKADLVKWYPIPPENEALQSEPNFAPTANWFKAWTELGIEHGDLAVRSYTDGGAPQWSKSVLRSLVRDGSTLAERILEYRDASKKAEFLTSWLELVTPAGTIHPNYNVGSVKTGRLSSSKPNAQQITAVLKAAFLARPGYCIVEFDYSQIEMRVAAFISRCVPMMRAFQNGQDLHRMLAAQLTGKALEDVTKEERQNSKAGNFGLLYEMSAFGFQAYAENAYGVLFTMEESEEMYLAFYELWDGIGDWHAAAKREAHRTGQIVSPLGRIRRLPKINWSDRSVVREEERKAVNSPVQGMASDICMIAASIISGTMPGYRPVEGAFMIGTVHDSLVAEVKIDRWEEISRQIMRIMTVEVLVILRKLGVEFDVPLAVECKAGNRWGTGDLGVIESE